MPPGARASDRAVIHDVLGRGSVSLAARGAYVQVTTTGRRARFGGICLVAVEDSARRTMCAACGDEHPDVLLLAAGGGVCALWAEIGRRGDPAFRAARLGDAAWPFGDSPIVDALLAGTPPVRLCKIAESLQILGQVIEIVPITIEEDAAPIARIGIEPYRWSSARQVGASSHATLHADDTETHVVLTVT